MPFSHRDGTATVAKGEIYLCFDIYNQKARRYLKIHFLLIHLIHFNFNRRYFKSNVNRYRRKRPKVDASIFDSALSHTRRSDSSEKREENSVSTFGRFRLWKSFESSPVSVNFNIFFKLNRLAENRAILKMALKKLQEKFRTYSNKILIIK